MQGLKLTYETLGRTRNEAAIDALISALDDDHAPTRRFALEALVTRTQDQSAQRVLASWEKLLPDDIRILRSRKSWIVDAIEAALKSKSDFTVTAIDAAESLELTSTLPEIILLAESSASIAVRQRATEAVLSMVAPLGRDARADRGQPTARGPVLARLADSVRRFSMHRNTQLVDAFLLTATWGDGDLRQMLNQDGPVTNLVCDRLEKSDHIGVIELAAGFLRRRNPHNRVAKILQSRADERFRDALLRCTGAEPTATVLRNLRDMGLPRCCRGGEQILDQVAPDYRAPLVHIYVATGVDFLQTLHLTAATLEKGGKCCEIAAGLGLSRCEIPDIDFWMRAAVPVADGDEELIASDDNARLLDRLIRLLDHPDPAVARGVRRVLGPLHADQMLAKFESLRPRSRRRLGRVVMMVDREAIQRVRDALRHPVLSHRLEAIATADALAAVDLLSDSFERIAKDDHQEARVKAAEVMSHAEGAVTLRLLHEMTDLPECPVRDAAVQALGERQNAQAT